VSVCLRVISSSHAQSSDEDTQCKANKPHKASKKAPKQANKKQPPSKANKKQSRKTNKKQLFRQFWPNVSDFSENILQIDMELCAFGKRSTVSKTSTQCASEKDLQNKLIPKHHCGLFQRITEKFYQTFSLPDGAKTKVF
jgi:hypothetical protein